MKRITQMYSAFGWHLKDNLKKKYGLSEVRKPTEPILAFGVYGSQIEKVVRWAEKTHVRCWWSGSDISYCFRGREHLIEVVRNHPNISHIATVNFIERDLQKLGFKYMKVPLFSQFIDDFKPTTLGDSIYIYKPGSAIYCPRVIYKQIQEKFKSVPIIVAHNHHTFTQAQLKEVYAKSILGIRLCYHDGASHTAIEMGLCGKKIVWNGDTPNAVNWKDFNETHSIYYPDVLLQIEKVLDEKYDHFEVAEQMRKYMDRGDSWLMV